jgi:exopolyphosphatase/guanosine-5'-triphosphate,3'-diphosphate pyrophosphatase
VTRVAAIDLGTNSTRLLVADVSAGTVVEVRRELAITRLGEDVDRRRRLLPTAVARVRNALVDYRRIGVDLAAERTLAVATSAVREAENGLAFLGEIEWSYGFETRLLSGEEEAELTFRGVTSDREIAPDTLLVDIGGGSTELILGGPTGMRFSTSLDIGCVRLTERFLHSDPPTVDELAECVAHVRSVLPALRVAAGIGVAGTVTATAAIELGLERYDPELVHGHQLSRDGVGRELSRLGSLALRERCRVSGLQAERAPVIVAGLVILREVMDAYGLTSIDVSERDILHGVALEAAALSEPEEGAAPPGAYVCC